MRWLAVAFLVIAAIPRAASTQQLDARVFLTPAAVGINGQFTLNVQVTGTRRMDADPELPDLNRFARYLGSSTSTSVQMINGRTAVSLIMQYRFMATKEGTFDIGAVRVEAAGQILLTSPVVLTVTATAPPTSGGAQGGGGQPAGDDEPAVGPEDLFVTAEVSKRTVYENEPVTVEYRIFTRVDVTSYSITSPPGSEGFWVEDIPQTQQAEVEQVVRDGQQYATAVVRRVVLFPTGPGTRTVDALTIDARVRVQRRSQDIFGNFFNRSPLFASQEPIVVTSDPVEIEVLPLPEGRPASFSGLVGKLALTASVDRTRVETNEAVTLRVVVTGEGNLRGLAAPTIDFPGDFEVFPPEVSESIDRSGAKVRGTKTYDYVLLPRAPGERTIPPVEMSYFDGETARYATARTEPIVLDVTGAPLGIAAPGGRVGVETLREDIRFIMIAPPRFVAAGRSLLDDAGFWIVALLPLVAVAGAAGLRRHSDRLEGDVAYARGRRAGRVAKKRLGHARALLSEGEARDFYAEVERALRGFLADKLNVSEAGFMSDDAESELRERGVPRDVAGEYLECLGVCDRARFAPEGASSHERADFFERAAAAMTAVQEGLN